MKTVYLSRLLPILFLFFISNYSIGQSISFESYVLLPSNTNSFSNSRILSFSSDLQKIYVGVEKEIYTGSLELNHGTGSNNAYSVYEYSNSGTLLNTQDGNFFHIGKEYMHNFFVSQTNNTAFMFMTRPSFDYQTMSSMTFKTPCSYLGLSSFNITNSNFNYNLSPNCDKFNHFYSGLIYGNQAIALYNDKAGDHIRKWDLSNLGILNTYSIEGMESLPFVNPHNGLIYYISEKESSNNILSGKIISINFEGEEQNSISFTSNIENPRVFASADFNYIAEPYKNNFLIERVNSSGVTDFSKSFPKKFHSVKILNNGNLILLVHDISDTEEPNKLYLLDNELNTIGSVAFGISNSVPVSFEVVDDESIIYISGIVSTSRLLDESKRKSNSSMLVKITLEDLQNSIDITNILDKTVK